MKSRKASRVASSSRLSGSLGWFLAGVAGAVALSYAFRSRSGEQALQRFAGMGAGPVSSRGDADRKLEPNWHEGRDAVEEASWESFPASDPPSF